MLKKRTLIVGAMLLLLLAIATACGGNGDPEAVTPPNETENQEKPPETQQPEPESPALPPVDEYKGGPVELTIQDRSSGLTDEEVVIINEALQAKYPDIKITLVKGVIEEMIAANSTPDLVMISNPNLYLYTDIEYPEDSTEMINRFNIDFNRFDPTVVEEMHKLGDHKVIYGVPFGMNYSATIYNKNTFDKFGVDFPGDEITWNDYLEYARRMTMSEDGIQYIGASPFTIANMLMQYGVSNADEKDEKAVFTSQGHQDVYSLLQNWFNIPNYITDDVFIYPHTEFFQTQRVAIYPYWIAGIFNRLKIDDPQFDWDLTTVPVFEGQPKQGYPADFHIAIVAQTSKNKEAAYRFLEVLTSDETQSKLSKNGRLSVLKDETIRKSFAEDTGVFKDKNLNVIFNVPPAPVPDYSNHRRETNPLINEIGRKMALEGADVNTALREAEEEANMKIAEKQ